MKVHLVLLWLIVACNAACDPQQTFTVQVGFENMTASWGLYGIYPSNFTVHVGDTVTFVSRSMDPHALAWNPQGLVYPQVSPTPPPYNNTPYTQNGITSPAAFNPYVAYTVLNGRWAGCGTRGAPACVYDGSGYTGSGILQQGSPVFPSSFSIIFNTSGTYTFNDVFYTFTATVNVVPFTDANSNCIIIESPANVTNDGNVQLQAQLSNVPVAFAQAQAAYQAMGQFVPSLDGKILYNILTGYSNETLGVVIQQFFPQNITCAPGDVLNFVLGSAAPHVVAFTNGAAAPLFVNPQPNTCCINPGPMGGCNSTTANTLPSPFGDFPCFLPILLININVLFAEDPTVLGGSAFAPYQFRSTQLGTTGLYSSGLLSPPGLTPQPVTSYQFKVNFTGSNYFQCQLHSVYSMQGSVSSAPPTATPPPVYHVTQYSTQFDGPGACTSRQQIGSYTLVPNVCRRIGMTFPFYMYFKATPANGPPSSNVTGATYVHLMRWDLFNALPDCGLGPAITPPAVNCLVPLDGTCTVCHKDVQYRITLASGLVPSAVWLLVALALALTMV